MPAELKQLIESCWTHLPEKRPSFQEIIDKAAWQGARNSEVLKFNVKGEKIKKKILENFMDNNGATLNEIKYSKILKSFIAVYKLEGHVESKAQAISKDNIGAFALRAILGIGNTEMDFVKKDRVEMVLLWCKGSPPCEFLNSLINLCKQSWFWGVQTEQAAHRSLLSKPKEGHFLVYWEALSFKLSYVLKEKKSGFRVITEDLEVTIIADLIKKITVKKLQLKLKKSPNKLRPAEFKGVEMICRNLFYFSSSNNTYTQDKNTIELEVDPDSVAPAMLIL